MFRHGTRRLEFIPFVEGQPQSIDLPRDRLIKRVNLQFNGDLVLAGGANSGLVLEDATLLLAPRIEIIADGITTLYRSDARGAYYKQLFESSTVPHLVNPLNGNAGITHAAFNLDIHFQNNIGRNPSDTFLDSSRYRTLKLEVTWGTLSSLFTAVNDRTKTMANSWGIRPVVHETTMPARISLQRIQDYIDKEITASNTDFPIDIPVGQRLYQAMMLMTTDGGNRQNDIINFFDVLTGEKFTHYQKMPWQQLQRMNQKDFHIPATPDGCAYLMLTEDGLGTSGLAVNDVNTAKLNCDVTVGAGLTKVRLYHDTIYTLI